MKNFKLFNKVLAVLMLGSLAACGSNDDDNNNYYGNYGIDPRYAGFASACGVGAANFGNAPYMQTIRASDSGVAELDLLVYGDGSGNVQVVGEIFIPDVSRLGIGLTGGSFRSCVTGSGQMETNVTDPAILINLQGNGITLSPRNSYQPYIRGSVLKGDFNFTFNGRSDYFVF
jgi:hypothetical protein